MSDSLLGCLRRSTLAAFAALFVATCHVSPPPARANVENRYDPADLDPGQDPCADFYRYARGGWSDRSPIPPDFPESSIIGVLVEKNRDTIRRIIEDAAAAKHPNPDQQKIGDFYAACMDDAAIERDGTEPIRAQLKSIESIDGFPALAKEIATLQFDGVDAPFSVGSAPGTGGTTQTVLQIEQGGLGLPQPDYYASHSDSSTRIRDEYARHIARTFQLAGDDSESAARRARVVVALETRLAESSMSRTQTRDPHAVSHPMTVEQLRALAPRFDWNSYFTTLGVSEAGTLNVAQPAFIAAVGRELESRPIDDWRTYLRWHLLRRASPALSARFVAEDFDFYSRRIRGVERDVPRWRRCVSETDSALSDAVGQMYVQQNYPPEALARSQEMVEELVKAFRDRLQNADWMDSSTKAAALQKLGAMKLKVGYPKTWRDYSQLAITRGYLLNQLRVSRFELASVLAEVGKATDRSQWKRPAQVPNASYNAATNDITIPAAVFQPPLYDPQADDALNYGGIGVLIAHEITHGFDDRGAKFDADGNLRNWWSDTAAETFHARVSCLVEQFNQYVVEGDVHENGNLVVGEGIADLGGAAVAYDAFQHATHEKERSANGAPTADQRFFLAYARMWSVNIRPEYARARAISDFHPIGSSRVNVPLANLPAFGRAFGCKAGDPMMRRSGDACTIW